jgi:hypothetical protein
MVFEKVVRLRSAVYARPKCVPGFFPIHRIGEKNRERKTGTGAVLISEIFC